MLSIRRNKRFPLAITAIALLAISSISVAMHTTSSSGANGREILPVAERFEVFSRAEGNVSRSTLSQDAQQWLQSIEAGKKGRLSVEGYPVPSTAAQEASVVSVAKVEVGDESVVVAALGQRDICAFGELGGLGTCASADMAEAGGAFSAAPVRCDEYRVIGIMPNGVRSLTVDSPGSSVVSQIPVRSNVYVATLGIEDAVLVSESPPVEVVVPLGAYSEMNSGC